MQESTDPIPLTAGRAGDDVAALTRDQITDLVGGRAGAAMVFGEPVTADGITLVPVARAGIGFGGIEGSIGGGTDIRPVGYIEISHGVARYRPIRDIWGRVVVPLAAMAAGVAAPWVLRSVRKLRDIRK
ncbi:sporulation protein [Nocardia colli]|uniref:Sporulation protein n=1 Tax=Nocardia colli TaxID=2545717 RepID=A0A5N0E943_9NOCA|nr:sporulation protein [Nocardia colli]KAA8885486.1 sporulation protein [Nocardia colli]